MAWIKRFDGKQIILVLLILATAGVLVAGYVAQAYQYENLLSLYAKSQSQLKQNGITPDTPSAGKVAQNGAPGSAGAVGDTGAKGDRGAIGQPGADGVTGTTGAAGAAGADGGLGATGGVGATGGAGTTGPPGSAGTPGTAGAPGSAGATGPAGVPGSAGAPGTPIYSFQYTTTTGILVVCSRDTPFDPAKPIYTCVRPTSVPTTP